MLRKTLNIVSKRKNLSVPLNFRFIICWHTYSSVVIGCSIHEVEITFISLRKYFHRNVNFSLIIDKMIRILHRTCEILMSCLLLIKFHSL